MLIHTTSNFVLSKAVGVKITKHDEETMMPLKVTMKINGRIVRKLLLFFSFSVRKILITSSVNGTYNQYYTLRQNKQNNNNNGRKRSSREITASHQRNKQICTRQPSQTAMKYNTLLAVMAATRTNLK